MNKKLVWLILSAAVGVSGCSFNIGTGANTPANTAGNAPASNAPAKSPAASPETTVNAAKSPEAAKPAAKSEDDPKSENETIQFAKGTSESTLDRTIAPGVDKMYHFTARKGQHVYFEVTEETGELEIDFNKRSVRVGEHIQQELNASGEWVLYISNPGNKTLKYKLFFGIDD